jgi:surface antigen
MVMRMTAVFILLLIMGAWCADAVAQPPAHAPAHGWRKKHDPYYVGYSGRHWEHDYGVRSGSCNREAVATVLGGVVGAVVGSRTSTDENRTVATITGAVVGAVIGKWIGRELDEADRACVGHSLEIGAAGQPITWANETTGVRYEIVPADSRKDSGEACREFTLSAVAGEEKSSQRGIACQSRAGVWEIVD